MILELSDQDNVALEEISKILERHPDLKLIEMVVEPTLIFNHLIIDTGKRKVYYNQQEVLLTTKEYELLYRLALYEGRVLSYREDHHSWNAFERAILEKKPLAGRSN